jgi:hypothetical protein
MTILPYNHLVWPVSVYSCTVSLWLYYYHSVSGPDSHSMGPWIRIQIRICIKMCVWFIRI